MELFVTFVWSWSHKVVEPWSHTHILRTGGDEHRTIRGEDGPISVLGIGSINMQCVYSSMYGVYWSICWYSYSSSSVRVSYHNIQPNAATYTSKLVLKLPLIAATIDLIFATSPPSTLPYPPSQPSLALPSHFAYFPLLSQPLQPPGIPSRVLQRQVLRMRPPPPL
jgi:hypothetical protein